jgi:permease
MTKSSFSKFFRRGVFMYWCLLGVLVVIIGFAIKLEPIAIIVVSAIVTAIFGGINVIDLLETVGTTFVANRNQLITIILMILTGTLERNGLKEAGADLIRRAKGLTTGMLIAIWGVLDEIFIIFKIPIGGIPSFVRPIMMPMTLGIIESKGYDIAPEHEETIKALYGKDYNVSNFFGQCLFAANSSVLLIQSTLASIGYDVDVMQIVMVQVPVAIFAMIVNATQTLIVDKRMIKKYYPDIYKSDKKPAAN